MRGIKQVLGRVDWLSVFFTLLFLVAVVLLGLSFIGPHATAFAIAGSTGAPIFFGALDGGQLVHRTDTHVSRTQLLLDAQGWDNIHDLVSRKIGRAHV